MNRPMPSTSVPLVTPRALFVPNVVDWVALALTIVGGINWGSVGLLDVDLVASLFGVGTLASRLVYLLVGLSALYLVSFFVRLRRTD
jgi:uncharacterized membrane protein YuzA (DUF378 family)